MKLDELDHRYIGIDSQSFQLVILHARAYPILSVLLSKYPTAHSPTCLAAAPARAGMLFFPSDLISTGLDQ